MEAELSSSDEDDPSPFDELDEAFPADEGVWAETSRALAGGFPGVALSEWCLHVVAASDMREKQAAMGEHSSTTRCRLSLKLANATTPRRRQCDDKVTIVETAGTAKTS